MNGTTKKISIVIIAVSIVSMALLAFVWNKQSGGAKKTDDAVADSAKEKFTIVAFGDSLTAGLGVDLKDSYPSILERILNTSPEYKQYNRNFVVINMGVSGETSSGGIERVDFVLSQKPDLILFGLGANDMLRSTSPKLVRSNIDSMVQRLTSSKTPVVLLGMQSVASNGNEYKAEFDSIYPSIAKQYSLPIVPFFLDGVAQQASLNTPDGIHPNMSGYEQIVQKNILPVLDPVLKKLVAISPLSN